MSDCNFTREYGGRRWKAVPLTWKLGGETATWAWKLVLDTEQEKLDIAKAIQERLNRDWGVDGEDGLSWEDALSAAEAALDALPKEEK